MDIEAKRKILSPLPEIKLLLPGRPARSQTLYWLSYPALKQHQWEKLITITTTTFDNTFRT
jgi:hypothetical protein